MSSSRLSALRPGCVERDEDGRRRRGVGPVQDLVIRLDALLRARTANAGMGLHRAFAQAVPWSCRTTTLDDRIVVALLDVRDWTPWHEEALAILAPTELARVRRRRFQADRSTLVVAYALHRLLLAAVIGCRARDVPLYRDANGCPRVLGGRVQTSLSHAGGMIALAATSAGPVGIDLEQVVRAAAMPEIAARICHPDEVVALAVEHASVRAASLLSLWVRKEALLKAAGVGLAIEMDQFALPADGVVRALPASGLPPTRVRMLAAGGAVFAAIAGPPGIPVESGWLRPQQRCNPSVEAHRPAG